MQTIKRPNVLLTQFFGNSTSYNTLSEMAAWTGLEAGNMVVDLATFVEGRALDDIAQSLILIPYR